jgi:hypothetical protein
MAKETITSGVGVLWSAIVTMLNNMFTELYGLLSGGDGTVTFGGQTLKGSSTLHQLTLGATYNTLDDSSTAYVLGGGRTGFGNHIGRVAKPAGTGYIALPTSWTDDSTYTPGTSIVSTIIGGYDNVANGIASRIVNSDHCYIKSNATGHNGIFGSTYGVIDAGQSGLLFGNTNEITGGTYSYSYILGGYQNKITNSSFASILPTSIKCSITTSPYALAWGRRAIVSNAAGSFTLADSIDADLANTRGNSFKARFVGGFMFNATATDRARFGRYDFTTGSNDAKSFSIVTSDWVFGSTGSALIFKTGADTGNTYTSISQVTRGASAFGNIVLAPAGGNVGLKVTSPTAYLHLPASTAAANTASLKIDAGVLATTPVTGNIESDGVHLYWTNAAGERKQLDN